VAQPPVNTMPKPKIAPHHGVKADGRAWNVLRPVSVTPAETRLNSTTAIMMPTAMRGTPTANRSRIAEAMQNRPYCSAMP
jgi:hypothetical protein